MVCSEKYKEVKVRGRCVKMMSKRRCRWALEEEVIQGEVDFSEPKMPMRVM